jgi:2-oxo-3-hexenedioate decarboxylase
MNPTNILDQYDRGQIWPQAPSDSTDFDVAQAYQQALAVRALRLKRGELARGFKIGFTNRNIWPIYKVYAPIWGSVYNCTLTFCDGQGTLSLAHTCQPRLEPEVVFGMKRTPAPNATLDDLFDAIDWVAPGFEVVQSHLPDWKFKAADTVADGGLHAHLLVGRKLAITTLASNATQLDALLAQARVTLFKAQTAVDQGCGANVLDSPLRALHHFLTELRTCAGAPDLMPGDVVTTGTWTDAWPVLPGECWTGEYSDPLGSLTVSLLADPL